MLCHITRVIQLSAKLRCDYVWLMILPANFATWPLFNDSRHKTQIIRATEDMSSWMKGRSSSWIGVMPTVLPLLSSPLQPNLLGWKELSHQTRPDECHRLLLIIGQLLFPTVAYSYLTCTVLQRTCITPSISVTS